MNKPGYLRINTRGTPSSGVSSCLTINEPGSEIGLSNLLDLIGHEIRQEDEQEIHRLTFKSGQTLCIKADAHTVTIRGAHINFNTNPSLPQTTLLSDPAKSAKHPLF